MILSVNWLKQYTDIDLPVDELATLIGARLVEIESVTYLGEKYKDVVVARVAECANLEGSDHLHVTKIDDGGVVADVERDENGLVQIVCGAPNVREGLLVAWLPPRSVVPETFGDAEPFVLASKPLRGVLSHGMLASARELDLYDDHTGILEIDKPAKSGASFAELYELDDYLLDIENKSLTHRPDTFGVIGFAREVAGIQGKAFTTPDWLQVLNPTLAVVAKETRTAEDPVAASSATGAQPLAPAIQIDQPGLSERFQAVVLTGVNETARSPIQLQTYLARSGVRPINALVDVSNYLMLLTGQPSHTYDYDKFKAVAGDDFTVHVRLAHPEETLTLLDGNTVTLAESDIVIAAGDTAVGLAGIMGGQSTATDAGTRSVLLEAATFDLYHMRSSQMRHGIFSEAVTRFTKGIPAALSAPVLARAIAMLGEQAGTTVASGLLEDYPNPAKAETVTVSEQHINQTLGTAFSAEDIAGLLENVGFGVSFKGLTAQVSVPYWRKDIHLPEDIIEEVGRLAGFDTINLTLPRRHFVAVHPGPLDVLRSQLRASLVRGGANEVLTYSFVHGDVFQKAGQTPDNAYRVTNSISPDLQYYRQSLTPSLLAQVHANTKAGYEAFALFEMNKSHQKVWDLTDESVPVEANSLALVLAQAKRQGSPYYDAKALLEYALRQLGVDGSIVYRPLQAGDSGVIWQPFEPKRSALVYSVTATDKVLLGIVGEYKASVRRAFKLPDYTAGFELDTDRLLEVFEAAAQGHSYQPLSRYPGSERDLCFQVKADMAYARLVEAANTTLEPTGLLYQVAPLDFYQAEGADVKNITIRISLTSYDKTLTSQEVTAVIDEVVKSVTQATDGKVL